MTTKIEAKENFIIGVISDTHGHVPTAVPKAFNNADLIIHAGDIGDQKVLDQLSKIAPVVAVRGNMDFGKWSGRLPEAEIIKIGQITLYVLHIATRLAADPPLRYVDVVQVIVRREGHNALSSKSGKTITWFSPLPEMRSARVLRVP